MQDIAIGNQAVSENRAPLIVAELSGNHNGSLSRALQLVEAAAEAGANAIKIQTYTPDTMTLDICEREFVINDESSPWRGRSLHDLYREAQTPWEWHRPIFGRANALGLVAFSTPFDISAVEFLESLAVPAYKIASFEITDLPLVERVAATGRPVIISTGMATAGEIETAVMTVRRAGNDQVILLKCSSSYPASPSESNLRTIPHMQELFKAHVGLSDHTLGVGAALAAVALGARVIEKHLTLSRADGGVDAAFSLEPAEMALLVKETRSAWESLGHVSYGATGREVRSLRLRRSLYVVDDLRAGDLLTSQNTRRVRPALGLPPAQYELVLGKRVNRDVKRGTPLTWDLIG